MKNLKRALSFALASVMVIGMMVVGAGAAFTDADEIVNEEAVNTLVALNVIAGKEDGSYFDPTGIVTRAEMAKMITVALNGGKDPVLGTKATPTYTDIKGTWAEAYIEYCSNLGIIAGKGDGTFDPTGTVTGTEAAKMILTALGYDAEIEKFVNNSSWAININRVASSKDLYEDLTIDPAAGLTRDDAAQMIWNGMNAEMVKYVIGGIVDGTSVSYAEDKTGKTILTEKFKMIEEEGTLTAIEYDSDEEEYIYTVSGTEYKSEQDFSDLFAMDVTVLYKNVNGKDVVYGIVCEGDVVAEGLVADLDWDDDDDKLKVGDTVYATDKTSVDAHTIYNYNVATDVATSTLADSADMKVLDTDGNGKTDTIVVYPFTVKEVKTVSKTSFKVGTSSSIDKEDVVVYDGIAKGDFVKITAAANTTGTKDVYEKVETVLEGKVTNTKNGGADVKIDGEWYTLATGVTAELKNTYKKMPVVNGYIFASTVKESAAAADEYAVLVKAEAAASGLNEKAQGILLLTDGTKITVDLADNYKSGDVSLEGKLVTYEVEDDVYTLEAATDEAFDGEAETKAYDDSKIDGMTIADDAVIFIVKDDGTGHKVITGAELKKTDSIDVTNAYYNTNDATGFKTVVLAYVTGSVSSTSDNLYGYITADLETALDEDDNTVAEVTMWTGDETVTVTTKKDVSVAGLTKGDLVVYKTNADGLVTSIKKITDDNAIDTGIKAYLNVVTAYADDEIAFRNGTVYEITEDTVIMYINSDKVEGVADGVISLADKDVEDNYVSNVYVAVNADKEVILLVVDDNNEMK